MKEIDEHGTLIGREVDAGVPWILWLGVAIIFVLLLGWMGRWRRRSKRFTRKGWWKNEVWRGV